MPRLSNKIALVTGAARGIGQAIAQAFAREGAFVIITDVLDDLGQATARQIGDTTALYHALDVSDEAAWSTVMAMIRQRFGRLDVVVNNAGIIGFGPEFGPQDPEHASLASWHRVHAVNLDGVFLGCKYGIALMKNNGGGAIVNISSRSDIVGIPGAAAYASSKAAIRNHTKSVALYCAENRYNIRCNSIHPAAILTPLWDPMLGDNPESTIQTIAAGVPLKRMGAPEDVAWAAVYLASDEATYLTGIELNIDGGILAGSASSPKPKE